MHWYRIWAHVALRHDMNGGIDYYDEKLATECTERIITTEITSSNKDSDYSSGNPNFINDDPAYDNILMRSNPCDANIYTSYFQLTLTSLSVHLMIFIS